MSRIDAAESGEKLTAFQLQPVRQTGRLQESFFELDIGFVVVVQFLDNIGEAFEVRINRAVERELVLRA